MVHGQVVRHAVEPTLQLFSWRARRVERLQELDKDFARQVLGQLHISQVAIQISIDRSCVPIIDLGQCPGIVLARLLEHGSIACCQSLLLSLNRRPGRRKVTGLYTFDTFFPTHGRGGFGTWCSGGVCGVKGLTEELPWRDPLYSWNGTRPGSSSPVPGFSSDPGVSTSHVSVVWHLEHWPREWPEGRSVEWQATQLV